LWIHLKYIVSDAECAVKRDLKFDFGWFE